MPPILSHALPRSRSTQGRSTARTTRSRYSLGPTQIRWGKTRHLGTMSGGWSTSYAGSRFDLTSCWAPPWRWTRFMSWTKAPLASGHRPTIVDHDFRPVQAGRFIRHKEKDQIRDILRLALMPARRFAQLGRGELISLTDHLRVVGAW